MVENKQDALARAYVMLSSLRKNIEQITALVPETYMNEFHSVLTKLEGMEIDVSEFRIPDSEINPRVTSIHTLTFANSPKEGADYSKERYVEKAFILTKMDAIIGYLKITTSKKPRKMGYPTPDNK